MKGGCLNLTHTNHCLKDFDDVLDYDEYDDIDAINDDDDDC